MAPSVCGTRWGGSAGTVPVPGVRWAPFLFVLRTHEFRVIWCDLRYGFHTCNMLACLSADVGVVSWWPPARVTFCKLVEVTSPMLMNTNHDYSRQVCLMTCRNHSSPSQPWLYLLIYRIVASTCFRSGFCDERRLHNIAVTFVIRKDDGKKNSTNIIRGQKFNNQPII